MKLIILMNFNLFNLQNDEILYENKDLCSNLDL